MQWRYAITLIAGMLLVLAGIALPYTGIAFEEPASIALVSAGIAMMIVAAVTGLRYRDEIRSDERTKKIGAYGITYSWLLTLVLITVFFWLNYLNLVVLTVQGVLAVLLFAMVLSARFFQWHLFRKGDVD
jgi:protein-S-isoprenylcysteine O-methyltransferase Ste14